MLLQSSTSTSGFHSSLSPCRNWKDAMDQGWWPKACVVFLLTLCHGAPMVDACEPTNCSTAGPVIRSPFRRSDQPPDCGYKGFELSCNGNATLVDLPSAGRRFVVRSISYENQRLYLDPESCPLDAFLNLDLSNSPFELHDSIQRWEPTFMLLNCTCEAPTVYLGNREPYNYLRIRCLDGQGRHIFGVSGDWLSYLNKSCISMRTQMVPQAFITSLCSGHRYDPSLGWRTPKQKGKWIRFAGVSIGAFLFISALATIAKLCLSWKWKKDKETADQMKIEKFLEECKALNPERYSYVDIKKITDQFKTKLGEGGYGSVYKGLLPSGIEVAVKVLIRTVGNVGEEFVNEVQTIGRIHHVNVVRLLGFCADGKNRALIYEFMPNESLEKYIFPEDRRGPPLGWTKLHEIAVGIARGIEYLHQGCDQRILHFDIKPHNILLDHNLTPKISDFGLSKLCSKEQSVDLELGPNIIEEQDANIARVLAVTALWCIQWYPVNRPSIKTVVQMLEGSVENLVIPPNPFVSTASIALDSKPRVHGTILPAISESETLEIN
ncbi:hypothetical protein Taro_054293 [Colocasia esculenta]|uniref:non-specific serine/threonine protein kinase n=1 Tax=Colocasia esculenta TaxID=4460 RepID=A0A843XQS2_COLES|nr:hypothetical protein [Colocasia esculenta]